MFMITVRMFMILVDNCGYYCVNFILFLENYVQCKEIISDFSLKWGGGGGGGGCL